MLCYTETQHNEQPLTPRLFIEVTGEEGEKQGKAPDTGECHEQPALQPFKCDFQTRSEGNNDARGQAESQLLMRSWGSVELLDKQNTGARTCRKQDRHA